MESCYCEHAIIRRGATVSNGFSVDIDLRDATVYAWYKQGDTLLFEKRSSDADIVVGENSIAVNLSQEETLNFSQKSKDAVIAIQIGYIFEDGRADRSNIIYATVGEILSDNIMQYIPIE